MYFRTCLFLIPLLTVSQAFFLNEEECLNYTIYPIQYDLTIIPYTHGDGSCFYDCDITINIIANVPGVQVIELDLIDMEVKSGSVKVFDNRNIDIVNAYRPYEYKRGKLFIYLREPLRKYTLTKNQYSIKMSFRKQLSFDSESGIFAVKYDEGGPKYFVTTRLSPNKAKFFFPCIDNPFFESVFKFRVYKPHTQQKVQYNTSLVMAEKEREIFQDRYTMVEYHHSAQIPLYQVGFHYSNFASKVTTARVTNDTLIIWAPGPTLEYYGFITEFGKNVINLIHDYANSHKPLLQGSINIVAVPLNLDGYETGSFNLLSNSVNRLAYVQEYTSIKQVEKMTFELSQQLCRIWLGNPQETQKTKWKEEWFKEGVATYLAYYFLAQYHHGKLLHPSHQNWPLDLYGLSMKHKSMNSDWHRVTPSLLSFNRTLAVEIPSKYKELVTMKTASILWMVENWIGSEKFHNALVKYINSRRGQYISLNDFMASLDLDTVECLHQFFNGSTASKVLSSWFGKSGYPVINVHVLRDRHPNAIQLKQRQFSYTDEHRGPSDFLIPIAYIAENNENCYNCHRPKFTIGRPQYTFEENLNGGWILLNRNASGYYRVNYDEATWRLIAKSLKKDPYSIDPLNRAQIVNDVFALYTAGDINIDLAREILGYLDKEDNNIVWEAAIDGFDHLKIEATNCAMNKVLYEDWQKFMQYKIAPIYGELQSDLEQQPKTRLFRSSVVEFSCYLNYQPCLNDMRYMYKARLLRNQRLDPDSRQACYYLALSENGGKLGLDRVNVFEQEDLDNARSMMQRDKQFQYRIPLGTPQPMPIIMSTTTAALTVEPSVSTIVTPELASPVPCSSLRVLPAIANLAVLFIVLVISQ